MTVNSTPLILIVEDDDAIRATLADILDIHGYSTLTAANGQEALDLAREQDQLALIISDISMPLMSGLELLRKVRADDSLKILPMILLTAKADRASVRLGMEMGADDYITKPFTEEEVLRSISARLEKRALLDELDAFAHTVAHDLKNPLCTLQARIDYMEMMIDSENRNELKQQCAELSTSCFRLSNIINELLILSSVRRQTIIPEPLNMKAIVQDALDRLERQIQTTGSSLKLSKDWPVSVGHGPWVTEIWSNYISNAAKYGGENPVIELGGEPCDDGLHIRYWVRDCGPGIDPEMKRKLFFPLGGLSSLHVRGNGLGLSIVRRIVERLHGRVGVESEVGQGSCFWFELPIEAPTNVTTSAFKM